LFFERNESSSNKKFPFQYSLPSISVHEDWCWDEKNKSEKITIINNKIAKFFPGTISDGTAGNFKNMLFDLNYLYLIRRAWYKRIFKWYSLFCS
jgi:hypothetical protein